MPRYDVRCRSCGDTFEVTRSITALDEPMVCPGGHTDTVRLLSTIAVTGRSSSPGSRPQVQAPASGGGCCGGGCCS